MPEKNDKVIEARIGSSSDDFADNVVDAVGGIDDSQDLSLTDPELLAYSPYGRNDPLPIFRGGDWSEHLGGTLF